MIYDFDSDIDVVLAEMEALMTCVGCNNIDARGASQLDRYQRTTIAALIFYITRTKDLDASTLHAEVLRKYQINSLDELTDAEYESVVGFVSCYGGAIN